MLDQLPDFDDMDKLAEIIASSKAKLEDAKNLLEEEIARCIQDALTKQENWIEGKPPTMGYCTSVIAVKGNNNRDAEILKELKALIVKHAENYQKSKVILDNMKDRIAVWQTMSANQRKASF